jgi:hypothetical protein
MHRPEIKHVPLLDCSKQLLAGSCGQQSQSKLTFGVELLTIEYCITSYIPH